MPPTNPPGCRTSKQANQPTSNSGESRPVSRVLSGTVIHLGRLSPAASSSLPGCSAGHAIASLFGLASGGVYRAASVASRAVRSYRTLSPLPVSSSDHRRFAFCCTCPSLTAGRCYRPLCSTEPGLSSRLAMLRKPSRDKRPPRLLTSAGIVRQFGLGRIAVARFQQLPCRLATVASSRLFAHAVGKQDTPGDPVHQDAR